MDFLSLFRMRLLISFLPADVRVALRIPMPRRTIGVFMHDVNKIHGCHRNQKLSVWGVRIAVSPPKNWFCEASGTTWTIKVFKFEL